MTKKDTPRKLSSPRAAGDIPKIRDSGGEKTLLVNSDHLDVCMKAYYDLRLDGIALESYSGYTRKDTDFLKEHPGIERIAIIGSSIDPSGIRYLDHLRDLLITTSRHPLDLRPCVTLTRYSGDWHPKLLLPAPARTALERLRLWGYAPVSRNLETLGPYHNLKELLLVQSNLESLSGISGFGKISRLELNRLSKLRDISDLRNLRVEKLILDGCRKIEGWDIIPKLKGLERLAPRNCGEPESISQLSERLANNP